MKRCEMPNCQYDNLTKGPYCTNCNANVHTWSRRPIEQLLERKRKLGLYSNRMGMIQTPVSKRKTKR